MESKFNRKSNKSKKKKCFWDSPSVIKSELILDTSLQPGITISLSNEENNKVKIFDRIKEIMPDNILENKNMMMH